MKRPSSVDVYDFDHTIYDGDCSLDFYFYCIKRKPSLLRFLLGQAWHALLFALKIEKRTDFKSHFFAFLGSLGSTEKYVADFWNSRMNKIKPWYRGIDHSRDVIISASPEFLLRPAARELGVYELIATKMDPATGVISGKNCRGEEKVVRYKEIFGDSPVEKAYGDSEADRPIMSLAREAFLVKGNEITSWS